MWGCAGEPAARPVQDAKAPADKALAPAAFRGPFTELIDILDDAFAEPYAGFTFDRSGEPQAIRETSTRRQLVKIAFQGRGWQTLTAEIASPEGRGGADPELVLAAVSIRQFGLNSPRRIAVMSTRYQIAQKLQSCARGVVGRKTP